jgi:hypothetical protein
MDMWLDWRLDARDYKKQGENLAILLGALTFSIVASVANALLKE